MDSDNPGIKYIHYFVFNVTLFTAVGLLPGGGGYFTCIQNMKLEVLECTNTGGMYLR